MPSIRHQVTSSRSCQIHALIIQAELWETPTLTHTIPPNRTTSHQCSFFLSTGRHWNQLPQSLRSLPHASFKRAIAKRLGVPKPPAYYTAGSKTGNTLHTRLRTEMSHLNSHLFQINKCPSPECSCGHPVENNRHFILSCQNHSPQRDELFLNASRILGTDFNHYMSALQLRILINGESFGSEGGRAMAYHFQNFLLNSNRFINN